MDIGLIRRHLHGKKPSQNWLYRSRIKKNISWMRSTDLINWTLRVLSDIAWPTQTQLEDCWRFPMEMKKATHRLFLLRVPLLPQKSRVHTSILPMTKILQRVIPTGIVLGPLTLTDISMEPMQ